MAILAQARPDRLVVLCFFCVSASHRGLVGEPWRAGLEDKERDALLAVLVARSSAHPRLIAAAAAADIEQGAPRVMDAEPPRSAVLVGRCRLRPCLAGWRAAARFCHPPRRAGGRTTGLSPPRETLGGAPRALVAEATRGRGPEVQLKHVIAQAADESRNSQKGVVDRYYDGFRAVFRRGTVPKGQRT